MAFSEDQLVSERDKLEPWLNGQAGFNGTGVGIGRDGQVCLKIFTNHMPNNIKQEIDSRLQSLPHEFEETGEMTSF